MSCFVPAAVQNPKMLHLLSYKMKMKLELANSGMYAKMLNQVFNGTKKVAVKPSLTTGFTVKIYTTSL